MAGKQTLRSSAGGSITLQPDDSLTTDEVVIVQDPIGVNQTWQDVISQRQNDTDYVNDTGRPIMLQGRSTSAGQGSFIIDGINATFYADISLIIPAGSTYNMHFNNGADTWLELR